MIVLHLQRNDNHPCSPAGERKRQGVCATQHWRLENPAVLCAQSEVNINYAIKTIRKLSSFEITSGLALSYLHQAQVKTWADGTRVMPYTAPMCNKVINMIFLHTIIIEGLGPSFSLYVSSNTSSLFVADSASTSPFLCLPGPSISVSVILAVILLMNETGNGKQTFCYLQNNETTQQS